MLSGSFWKKNAKIADRNFENVGPQFLGWQRELAVLKRFSHWN
jgi:hypothetical protein